MLTTPTAEKDVQSIRCLGTATASFMLAHHKLSMQQANLSLAAALHAVTFGMMPAECLTCQAVWCRFDLGCWHGSMWIAKSNFIILLLLMLMVPANQPNIDWGVAIALQYNPAQPVNIHQSQHQLHIAYAFTDKQQGLHQEAECKISA